jgi:hypothetical protein
MPRPAHRRTGEESLEETLGPSSPIARRTLRRISVSFADYP